MRVVEDADNKRVRWRTQEQGSPIHMRKKVGVILPTSMALNIKDETADRLARELAAETGESITAAVTAAVRERLERLRGAVPRERRRLALTEIAERSAARRIHDRRRAEEIIGYGPDGLPV